MPPEPPGKPEGWKQTYTVTLRPLADSTEPRPAPETAGPINDRGIKSMDGGDPAAALPLFEQAVAIDPSCPAFHSNRGIALMKLGRHEEAERSLREALRLAPADVGALNNLGFLARERGDAAAAVRWFQSAVDRQRDNSFALYHLKELSGVSARTAEPVEPLLAELVAKPGDREIHRRLSEAVPANDGKDLAIIRAHAQLADSPDAAATLNNLAILYQERNALALADSLFRQALSIAPNEVGTLNNHGINDLKIGRFEEARSTFEKAVTLAPDDRGSAANLGYAQLLLGDLANGFRNYEFLWNRSDAAEVRRYARPPWTGEPLDGKTILVRAEWGYGDTIQFVRYCALLVARRARVVLECPRPLLDLFARLGGVDVLVAQGEALPPYDFHVKVTSLPHLFGTTLATIPSPGAYLTPSCDAVGRWAQRLGPRRFPTVALVWAGNPGHQNDRNRSIGLASWAAAFALDGVHFISVQVPPRNADIAAQGLSHRILDVSEHIRTFDDTAAVLSHADLLISVDTSVAHLAGALGIRTWVLVPFNPDWRWLTAGTASPWYRSLTVYRQSRLDDWNSVMLRIARDLRDFAGGQ